MSVLGLCTSDIDYRATLWPHPSSSSKSMLLWGWMWSVCGSLSHDSPYICDFSCWPASGYLLCKNPEDSCHTCSRAAVLTCTWSWSLRTQSDRCLSSWTPFLKEYPGWTPYLPGFTPRLSPSDSEAWQTALVLSHEVLHPETPLYFNYLLLYLHSALVERQVPRVDNLRKLSIPTSNRTSVCKANWLH